MRIDSHQHFWRYDPVRDSWITDSMAVLKRDFLPQDLSPALKASGVDGCIAVQADQSEKETLFLLDLAGNNSIVRGVVGWVDLCAPNVAERLEFFSDYDQLCGFRHIVQAEADDRFVLRKDFQHGIECLGEFGYTYDILIYTHQFPAAIELAGKFPDQPFVLDHLGKPPIKAKELKPWSEHIRSLAKNRNVYCKVSGMVTEADWKNWKPDDLKPYLDVLFETFGADRLMFGSDWPVCLLAGGYGEVLDLVAQYAQKLKPLDKDKLFGLNAVRFYGL
jgi:L-fuconolactonase